MASKSITVAENVYAPLVMVSLGAKYRTLGGKRGHHNGSIDTNFDPPSSQWTVPLRSGKDEGSVLRPCHLINQYPGPSDSSLLSGSFFIRIYMEKLWYFPQNTPHIMLKNFFFRTAVYLKIVTTREKQFIYFFALLNWVLIHAIVASVATLLDHKLCFILCGYNFN